jgi:hypothetical protein
MNYVGAKCPGESLNGSHIDARGHREKTLKSATGVLKGRGFQPRLTRFERLAARLGSRAPSKLYAGELFPQPAQGAPPIKRWLRSVQVSRSRFSPCCFLIFHLISSTIHLL